MFGFIAFGFKLLMAAITGGALSYIPGKDGEEHKIVETSLICLFGAAILGLANQFPGAEYNSAMGFGILAVTIVTISISKKLDFLNRIMWLFAAAAGMIIGSGYILQAALLSVLVYIILRNSDKLLNYLESNSSDKDNTNVEKISN
jgi:hypothetical protein